MLRAVDTFRPVFDLDEILRASRLPLNGRRTKTLTQWGMWLIELVPMLSNHRLVMTPVNSLDFWDYGWCYSGPALAVISLGAWNPQVDDEPAGWHKRAGYSIRRAPGRSPDAKVRCWHGHWPELGQCEYVYCEAWREPE